MVIEQLDPAYTHTAIAAVNDVLHFKGLVGGATGAVQENWVLVDAAVDQGTHWEYTGTRLGTSMPYAFPVGTTFTNYGASGEGIIRFDTEDTYQPYMEVLTHSGRPDTTVVRHTVVGRLQAFTGQNEYGIAVGADLDAFADNWLVLSEDRFALNRDLNVLTTKGFQFDDGGTADWVLLDDGTGLYTPGPAPGGTGLPTPSGIGYILRSDITPAFVEYYAGTRGAVLIGDGVTVVSDTTPTFVDMVSLDSGIGNSPFLAFVGGSNDDIARLYLLDNGVAGNSDFVISLCATDSDSQLIIADSATTPVAWIDADGNAAFTGTAVVGDTTIDPLYSAVVGLSCEGAVIGSSVEYTAGIPGAAFNAFTYGANASAYNRWAGRRSRGTKAVPAAVQSGDILGRFGAAGYDGATFPSFSTAFFQIEATENWNGSSYGTELEIYTTPDGSTSSAVAMRAQEDGIVRFPNSLRILRDTSNVTDLAPTDAQLDAAFGTPAAVGTGFFASVDDAGTGARVWLVYSDGTNWWYSRMYIAV